MPEEVSSEIPTTEAEHDSGWSLPCIGVALAALVVSLVIGAQLFRILYVVVFHPAPPLPDNMTRTEHDDIEFGVDTWTYTVDMNPCELVQFYEDAGGVCRTAENVCSGNVYTGPDYALDDLATCVGNETHSIFGLRWESRIYTQRIRGENITKLEITREMLWSGPAPPATSISP